MTPPSENPIVDWAGASGQAWLSMAHRLEQQLAPVSDLLFERAALRPGERVVDIGCGQGSTSRRAAELVAPGTVVAVDVAADLVESARSLDPTGLVDWRVADAQTADLGDIAADVVISRFGVMFFSDPTAAFTNLATAVRPGGRLCVAVWQTRDRSPYQHVQVEAARAAARRFGLDPAVGADDAGPFSLGIEPTVLDLLSRSGWTDVEYEPHTITLLAGGPGARPEDAAETQAAIGPFGAWMAQQEPEHRVEIRAAVAEALQPYATDRGVEIDGSLAIVTARRASTTG